MVALQASSYYGKQEKPTRPSAMEGQAITQEIVERYKLDYLARAFGVSHQAVAGWIGSTKDIFTRMRLLIRDLVDDGDEDLAHRIAKFFCGPTDCDPVPRQPNAISFTSIMKAITADIKKSAEVQVAISMMITNMRADEAEIEKCIVELDAEILAAQRLRGQLEVLRAEAKKNGGTISLDIEKLTTKTLRVGNR